jgi:pimeloyl-ACP methyl ester carboxylesterase
MTRIVDRWIDLHGQRFHYTETGEPGRPAVVFLHGITGHGRTWDEEARLLADRHHVLAPDLRGHGDSAPATDGDYTVATMADDLAAFVDALALPSIALVGLSLGGRVGIAYAATHPARVTRLMVIDIGPDIAEAGRRRVGALMAASPERFESVEAAYRYARAANPRQDEALLRARVSHAVRPGPDGGVAWTYDRAIRDAMRSGRWHDPTELWPLWRAITCPTLLVRGADSDVLSPEDARRMTETSPWARLVEVPDAGHTVPADQPAAFRALLREFVSEVARVAGGVSR